MTTPKLTQILDKEKKQRHQAMTTAYTWYFALFYFDLSGNNVGL